MNRVCRSLQCLNCATNGQLIKCNWNSTKIHTGCVCVCVCIYYTFWILIHSVITGHSRSLSLFGHNMHILDQPLLFGDWQRKSLFTHNHQSLNRRNMNSMGDKNNGVKVEWQLRSHSEKLSTTSVVKWKRKKRHQSRIDKKNRCNINNDNGTESNYFKCNTTIFSILILILSMSCRDFFSPLKKRLQI